MFLHFWGNEGLELKVVVNGGLEQAGYLPYRTVDVVNLDGDTFSTCQVQNHPKMLYGLAMAEIDQKLTTCGGTEDASPAKTVSDCYQYLPSTFRWVSMAPMLSKRHSGASTMTPFGTCTNLPV